MELCILGAHQGESDRYRFFSLMLGENLALDAGSLTSGLSWEAQAKVRSLLITHAHYDHIKDLNVLGFNHFNRGLHLDVYCLPAVRDAIRSHMFSRDIWLDLAARPSPEQPTVTFHEVVAHRTFPLEGYDVTPIPSIHTVPTIGYRVSKGERSVYYTGDTGPGNAAHWCKADPDLLITEITYDSDLDQLALVASHLTPARLGKELMALGEALGRIPPVLVVHVNPLYQEKIAEELGRVEREVGVKITLAHEGMRVVV